MKMHLAGLVFLISGILSGCSLGSESINAQPETKFLESGSISIARPVKDIQERFPHQTPGNLFGFMPVTNEPSTKVQSSEKIWAFIDRSAEVLLIQRGDETILSLRADVADSVPYGKFSMILKQENPLWYAPEEYFIRRNELPPAEGSSDRFRRGALGDSALFLNDDLLIHSAPINDSSISGIRLDPEGISNVYKLLPVGSQIIIR